MTDTELIAALRHAAAIWFKNTDLLLLEEFIKRFNRRKESPPDAQPSEPSV